jgi:hypothetical protein
MPLFRNRLILAAAESTYGTAATLAATDAVRIMNDLDLKPLQMELVNRDLIYNWVGNQPRLVSQQMASISFSFEMSGSGTAGTAPRFGPILRAAGHNEIIVASTSVTYNPVGSAYTGMTIDCHHGGKRHRLTGVRGNVTLDLSVNAIPTMKFEGMGFYAVPTDVSDPTTTYGAQADPLIVNSTNTTTVSVASFASCMESFSFNCGRSPSLRQLAGCSREVRIDNERTPEGEISIESPTITAKNFFADATAQTLVPITWTHGPVGNRVVFTASTSSLGDPEYADSEGIEMLRLPFMPIPGLTNGFNDYSIAFL